MDTKTARLIMDHIRVYDITALVINYLVPEGTMGIHDYAMTGFYEKCMEAASQNEVSHCLLGASKRGFIEIARLMIKKIESENWDEITSGYDWDWAFQFACGNGNNDIVQLIGSRARWCKCGKSIDEH